MGGKLRAVAPGEKAPQAQAKTILEAAMRGDRMEELVMMRHRIARSLDDPNTPARDLAALSRRQLEIGREIDEMKRRIEEEAEEDAIAPDEEWAAI